MKFRGITYFVCLAILLVSIEASPLPPRRRSLPARLVMKDGVEMALVPAGKYKIGSDNGPRDTRPVHEVSTPAFYMDIHEVTNGRYVQFCLETGHRLPSHLKGLRIPEKKKKLPVVNVSYADAKAYARWTKKTIPTEAEWEVAARGRELNVYPWGDAFRPVAAIRRRSPVPAGSRSGDISPYGILDMAGNVMEWTTDWYKSYPEAPKKFDQEGYKLVIRGAHFRSRNGKDCRTFLRHAANPSTKSPRIGFRCIKEIHYR